MYGTALLPIIWYAPFPYPVHDVPSILCHLLLSLSLIASDTSAISLPSALILCEYSHDLISSYTESKNCEGDLYRRAHTGYRAIGVRQDAREETLSAEII